MQAKQKKVSSINNTLSELRNNVREAKGEFSRDAINSNQPLTDSRRKTPHVP